MRGLLKLARRPPAPPGVKASLPCEGKRATVRRQPQKPPGIITAAANKYAGGKRSLLQSRPKSVVYGPRLDAKGKPSTSYTARRFGSGALFLPSGCDAPARSCTPLEVRRMILCPAGAADTASARLRLLTHTSPLAALPSRDFYPCLCGRRLTPARAACVLMYRPSPRCRRVSSPASARARLLGACLTPPAQ